MIKGKRRQKATIPPSVGNASLANVGRGVADDNPGQISLFDVALVVHSGKHPQESNEKKEVKNHEYVG